MGFYSNFISLCNSANKSPSRVVLDIGLKKSAVTRWKSGGNPTDATVQKIADYFGVSTDYLLTGAEKKPAPQDGDGLDELLERLRTRPECRMLFSLADGATKEDVEKAVAIIELIRKVDNK